MTAYWRDHYDQLRQNTQRFSDCFYDSTLPPEVLEAVAANLTILKSPTVLRQTDGRLWAWEGCSDNSGCCHGSCTHVWNYAQAIPHVFPALERTLRETEFGPSQDERGHQTFRSALPIRPLLPDFHAAADGQLGGIMKVYRDWRISGDTEWLRRLWPRVKKSLDYCIDLWDPGHQGWLEEPHHNTYDIEFWGPDGMCTSFYLGALLAAVRMGEALGDAVPLYGELLEKGARRMDQELYDGEYFIQKIRWKDLRAKNPLEIKSMVGQYSPEAIAILEKEGPKYQYGSGCLADGVLGAWLALVCGVGSPLDAQESRQPLASRSPAQSETGLDRARQPATARLCLRGRGRPAAVYVAQGRRAVAPVCLLERSLDRDRVPGGLAPDAHGTGRAGIGHRPRLPRPLRRPHPQPVQRIRMRPLVRAGHVELRPAAGLERRRYDAVDKGPVPAPQPIWRLSLFPQHGHRLRHGRRAQRQAVPGSEIRQHRGP